MPVLDGAKRLGIGEGFFFSNLNRTGHLGLGDAPVSSSGVNFHYWTPENHANPSVNLVKEKVFKCEFEDCDKAFGRGGDLTRHHLSHQSGNRLYSCLASRCGRKGVKGFWRLDKFKAHLDAKHPEIEVERWIARHYFPYRSKEYGYRDVTKVKEHEAEMLANGWQPTRPSSLAFFRIGPIY